MSQTNVIECEPAAPASFPPATARQRWLVLSAAFLGWMFDGLEMGIFPLVARPALQELMHVTDDKLVGWWMGIITALFLVGAAIGGLIFGWLGDRIGRVRAMALSVLVYSLFSGLCFFALAPWHLAVLRFLSALGMGGEWSLGVALVMECWPEARRPILAGAIGAASNVGFALIGALGFIFKVTVHSWRWVMLAGAAPAILTFFILLCVPESERWKRAVRERAAHPLREVLSPPLRRLTLLAVAFAAVCLIGTWASVQWIPLWVDQITHAALPRAKAVAQMSSALGAVAGCFAGALLAGSAGRRITYFLLCLASLVFCQILFQTIHSYGAALLGMAFLVGATTAAFYGWLPLYLPELFPTRVRATGQGLGFNFGRILAAGGVLGQGWLVGQFSGSYARASAVVTLIYVVGMVLIWFAPETHGKPLPE